MKQIELDLWDYSLLIALAASGWAVVVVLICVIVGLQS
jgi:hypothetical protein